MNMNIIRTEQNLQNSMAYLEDKFKKSHKSISETLQSLRAIDKLVEYFRHFDAVNFKSNVHETLIVHTATPNPNETSNEFFATFVTDFETIRYYLERFCTPENFKKVVDSKENNILKQLPFSCYFNAVVSFMLKWPVHVLIEFGRRFCEFKRLTLLLAEHHFDGTAASANAKNAYVTENGIVFVRDALYIFNEFFRPTGKLKNYFHLNHMDLFFEEDLPKLAKQLFDDENRFQSVNLNLDFMRKQHTCERYDFFGFDGNVKKNKTTYITGQACVGKSTLLAKLEQSERNPDGWLILNRGKIGSFGGKADSPEITAALHSALEFVLSHDNVLGDRGTIDNTLWRFIMDDLKLTDFRELVKSVRRNFASTFNLPCLGHFAEEQVAVIVDWDVRVNRLRMLARQEGQDVQRASIKHYAAVQAIYYYTYAVMCRKPVFDTQFNANKKLDHSRLEKYIAENFTKKKNKPLTYKVSEFLQCRPYVGKLSGRDYTFARDCNVYK